MAEGPGPTGPTGPTVRAGSTSPPTMGKVGGGVPLLRDPDFLRYAVARALSLIGNLATLVALPVLVYRITDSPAMTALVAALEAAPYAVFGLVAGALTDRWNRQRVMVVADILSAVLVASIPLAYALDALTVGHILAVAFLGPTFGTFFDGAVFGAIPTLVGRARIGQANSYVWSAQGLLEIVTPSVIGVALGVFHPAWLLGADAATFAVSAVLLAGISRPMHDAARVRPQLSLRQVGRDIAEGMGYLVRHPGVRTMTIVGFTQCVAGGGFVALMVVWIDRQLGVGTEGLRFGLVYGAWGVGGLIASLLLPRLLRRTTAARVALVALPISAALGILIPVWDRWWLGGVNMLLWGVAYTLVAINSITYRQEVTPEHLLSRVNTAGRMLAWGMGWTGGALLAGILAGPLGTRPTLFAMTAVSLVGVVVAATSPLRREVQ